MRLFLAGCDTIDFTLTALTTGHVSLLSSYYHALWRQRLKPSYLIKYSRIMNTVVNRWNGDWIMDSGLFSMMFGAGKGKTYTKTDLMKYTKRYIEDMSNLNFAGNIVEMDVHKVLGMSDVHDFRQYLIDHWDINRIIFVWHYEESLDGLAEMAEKYPFIALSIPEFRLLQDRMQGATIPQVIKHHVDFVRKINPKIKIHLLGNTTLSYMDLGGYYSADSTTWISGVKFARLPIFAGEQMHTIHLRDESFRKIFQICKPVVLKRASILEDKYKYKMIPRSDAGIRFNIRLMVVALSFIRMNKYVNDKYYGGEHVTNFWEDIYKGSEAGVNLDLYKHFETMDFAK